MYASNIDEVEVIIDDETQLLLETLEPRERTFKVGRLAEEFVELNAPWYEGTPEQCEQEAHVMAVYYEIFMQQRSK